MLYILLAILLYTGAIILGTMAARSANTAVVTTVINTTSALIPLAVAVPVVFRDGMAQVKTGIIYAVLAGLAIAFFTLALNKSYSVEKVAVVTPFVFGGAIVLSAILSQFVFKEKITLLQGCGLAIIMGGFLILIYARMNGK